MKKIKVITIDGPSASGKGALSRKVANNFNLNILDSGALYRLFAYLYDQNMTNQEISNAIARRQDVVQLAKEVHTHPTLSEVVEMAYKQAVKQLIN